MDRGASRALVSPARLGSLISLGVVLVLLATSTVEAQAGAFPNPKSLELKDVKLSLHDAYMLLDTESGGGSGSGSGAFGVPTLSDDPCAGWTSDAPCTAGAPPSPAPTSPTPYPTIPEDPDPNGCCQWYLNYTGQCPYGPHDCAACNWPETNNKFGPCKESTDGVSNMNVNAQGVAITVPSTCTSCRLDCGYALLRDGITSTTGRCVNVHKIGSDSTQWGATGCMAGHADGTFLSGSSWGGDVAWGTSASTTSLSNMGQPGDSDTFMCVRAIQLNQSTYPITSTCNVRKEVVCNSTAFQRCRSAAKSAGKIVVQNETSVWYNGSADHLSNATHADCGVPEHCTSVKQAVCDTVCHGDGPNTVTGDLASGTYVDWGSTGCRRDQCSSKSCYYITAYA